MKKFSFYVLIFVAVIFTKPVFSQQDTVKVLSPQQFNRVLQLNPNVQLIDIRPKKEFKRAHIKGAYLADQSELLFHLIDSLGTDKTYLLYCKYGERSIDAGKMIYERYKIYVCSLEGGVEAWLESGKELEK